jgi:hypothetical protein
MNVDFGDIIMDFFNFSTVEQEKQNQLAEGDDTNGAKD